MLYVACVYMPMNASNSHFDKIINLELSAKKKKKKNIQHTTLIGVIFLLLHPPRAFVFIQRFTRHIHSRIRVLFKSCVARFKPENA